MRIFLSSNHKDTAYWHVSRPVLVVGATSGGVVRSYRVAACSGRQVGGAWGQSELQREAIVEPMCPRCAALVAREGGEPAPWVAGSARHIAAAYAALVPGRTCAPAGGGWLRGSQLAVGGSVAVYAVRLGEARRALAAAAEATTRRLLAAT